MDGWLGRFNKTQCIRCTWWSLVRYIDNFDSWIKLVVKFRKNPLFIDQFEHIKWWMPRFDNSLFELLWEYFRKKRLKWENNKTFAWILSLVYRSNETQNWGDQIMEKQIYWFDNNSLKLEQETWNLKGLFSKITQRLIHQCR